MYANPHDKIGLSSWLDLKRLSRKKNLASFALKSYIAGPATPKLVQYVDLLLFPKKKENRKETWKNAIIGSP